MSVLASAEQCSAAHEVACAMQLLLCLSAGKGCCMQELSPPQTSANEGSNVNPLTVYSIPLLERSAMHATMASKICEL